MSSYTPTLDSTSPYLNRSLLAAIDEAGSYSPLFTPASAPPIEGLQASQLQPDRAPQHAEYLHASQPQPERAPQHAGYSLNPQHAQYLHNPQHSQYLSDPIEDIVFQLLMCPLSTAGGLEVTTIGLPTVIQCFGEHSRDHMLYDERLHRQCLRAGSDVIWRGEQLGLPKVYLDWLCAEGQRGSVNILRMRCELLEEGLQRWQEVTGRRM